jgi:hypothetical protein
VKGRLSLDGVVSHAVSPSGDTGFTLGTEGTLCTCFTCYRIGRKRLSGLGLGVPKQGFKSEIHVLLNMTMEKRQPRLIGHEIHGDTAV